MGQILVDARMAGVEQTDDPELPRSLLDHFGDAMILVDREGTIVRAEGPVAAWLSCQAANLAGASFLDCCPAAKRSHHKILINRVFETGEPVQFVDRQGPEWYDVLCQSVEAGGATAQIALYARNVTRQVEAEERLKRTVLQLVTGLEDERRRIAQDLHDDIGQYMTALLLSLKTTQGAIAAGDDRAGRQLSDSIAMVEGMMKQVRQILYQLRPPLLARQPLAEVLRSLCSSFAQASGLCVDFSAGEDLPQMAEAQAMVLYRCVQEGLNNAARHGQADTVWVSVDLVDGELNLALEDNGRGFNPGHENGLGLGLQGIRDRFLMFNGSFIVESAPGSGTRLFGSLPLTGRPHESLP